MKLKLQLQLLIMVVGAIWVNQSFHLHLKSGVLILWVQFLLDLHFLLLFTWYLTCYIHFTIQNWGKIYGCGCTSRELLHFHLQSGGLVLKTSVYVLHLSSINMEPSMLQSLVSWCNTKFWGKNYGQGHMMSRKFDWSIFMGGINIIWGKLAAESTHQL